MDNVRIVVNNTGFEQTPNADGTYTLLKGHRYWISPEGTDAASEHTIKHDIVVLEDWTGSLCAEHYDQWQMVGK
jgi:hypothetical protein